MRTFKNYYEENQQYDEDWREKIAAALVAGAIAVTPMAITVSKHKDYAQNMEAGTPKEYHYHSRYGESGKIVVDSNKKLAYVDIATMFATTAIEVLFIVLLVIGSSAFNNSNLMLRMRRNKRLKDLLVKWNNGKDDNKKKLLDQWKKTTITKILEMKKQGGDKGGTLTKLMNAVEKISLKDAFKAISVIENANIKLEKDNSRET